SSSKKDEKTTQNSRNLWVSGLSSSTRATDLKTLFSKYGKVVGAKVVTNARSPGSRCYGFVTMASADEATKSIQHLHRTELHGRMISVEKAKTEPQGAKAKVLPPSGLKSPAKAARPLHRSDRKPATPRKDGEHRRPSKDKSSLGDKKKKDVDVLSFEKIKAERERERLRRKELFLRQEERKRKLALEREEFKQRMIDKRQRDEAAKIEREKRRLRAMRDELERERIETERLRLETERLQIEREQEAYRKEQRALQSRRAAKRPAERPQEEWPAKRPERFSGVDRGSRFERKADRFEGDRVARREERSGGRHERFQEQPVRREREAPVRGYTGRVEEHRSGFREERPRRDARAPRDSARASNRSDSRSEWKSEREVVRTSGGGSWSTPVDSSWSTEDMGQGEGWRSGVVMAQPNSGFAMQPGTMMTGAMGTQTVFIAQPAMQGTPIVMQGNMGRQSDSRYGVANSMRRF
ncbi:unnamed protein product, partial [Candidula unifasciata]